MEFDSLNMYNGSYDDVVSAPVYKGSDTKETHAAIEQLSAEGKDSASASLHVGKSAIPADDLLKQNAEKNQKIDTEFIEKAIMEANKKLLGTKSEFHYSVHKKTNQISVKVVNSETKETIREIPPEKSLDAVAKMWEMVGILVDERG